MFWILSLLLLVALQPPHGSASLIGEEIETYEDVEVYEEDPRVDTTTVVATTVVATTVVATTLGPGTTPTPPDPCTPSCDGADNVHPMVPDPLDCHKYYFCFNEELNGPMDCPDGEYFNTTKMDCVPNGAEECTPICEPGPGGSCSYTCDDPKTEYIADRFDCSSRYKCSDNKTVVPCPPETPFFDGNDCQTEESACCHCKPYCYAEDAGERVVDPLDCTKYYFCFEGNEFPVFSGACPPGENFDIFKQECSSTAPCVTLCTNVINQDGCFDVFTCEELGYFAACPKGCDPRYYRCYDDDLGNTVPATICPDGKVFHPDKTTCVPATDCPYSTSRH